VGASEVEYVASYRDVASLSASGPERNHRCEEAFERVRVVLTLDPEPLAWGGRYRAPGGGAGSARPACPTAIPNGRSSGFCYGQCDPAGDSESLAGTATGASVGSASAILNECTCQHRSVSECALSWPQS
jgi:hypothetical protein